MLTNTDVYPLSLHDALPISTFSAPRSSPIRCTSWPEASSSPKAPSTTSGATTSLNCATSSGPKCIRRKIYEHVCLHPVVRCRPSLRSEEHTSELQSRGHLVCRLLLEKKNKIH